MTSFTLPVKHTELLIETTLQCGQSFRWKKLMNESWRGVIGTNIWTLKQDSSHLHCQVSEGNMDKSKNDRLEDIASYKKIISEYFRLDTSLTDLYKFWSSKDENFSTISKKFPGIRLLNQPVVENVFSFICSSNNNISRITLLVDNLCSNFGKYIGSIDGEHWYDFPSINDLTAKETEHKLKKLGFGYRAKYIHQSALSIMEYGGEEWLQGLRELSYEECRNELRKLSGIGPKVADCICLMSMGHLGTIPVDTHVFQVAARNYIPHLKNLKSVTESVHNQIGDYFRNLFGEKAGWAHSILFCADLKKFQDNSNSQHKRKKQRTM